MLEAIFLTGLAIGLAAFGVGAGCAVFLTAKRDPAAVRVRGYWRTGALLVLALLYLTLKFGSGRMHQAYMDEGFVFVSIPVMLGLSGLLDYRSRKHGTAQAERPQGLARAAEKPLDT